MDLKDKKILNLVLYSKINIYGNEINYYESMYKILSDYYKNYKFVDTIFYLNDETINTDFELNNDILKIKGKETYIPGIIKKTINVFEWVKNNLDLNNYSYIVRSNISTIIEFNKFRKVITSNPFDYGSFYLFNLNQLDGFAGIKDKKYFGTKYAAGTNIIINKNLFLKILENADKLDYTVIDDVAIGVLVKTLGNINYSNPELEKYYMYRNNNESFNLNDFIVFRNNRGNRLLDLERMKYIISKLKF